MVVMTVIMRGKVSSSEALGNAQICGTEGWSAVLTKLEITSIFSFAFLLFLFEVVRYSKIRDLALEPLWGIVADSRRSRVEGRPG